MSPLLSPALPLCEGEKEREGKEGSDMPLLSEGTPAPRFPELGTEALPPTEGGEANKLEPPLMLLPHTSPPLPIVDAPAPARITTRGGVHTGLGGSINGVVAVAVLPPLPPPLLPPPLRAGVLSAGVLAAAGAKEGCCKLLGCQPPLLNTPLTPLALMLLPSRLPLP